MRLIRYLTAALALLIVVPASASAYYTKSQAYDMWMGNSVTWAPDDDVTAMWRYYENVRGLDIVAAYPDYINPASANPYVGGWWFERRSGSAEYVVFRSYFADGVHHDVVKSRT